MTESEALFWAVFLILFAISLITYIVDIIKQKRLFLPLSVEDAGHFTFLMWFSLASFFCLGVIWVIIGIVTNLLLSLNC